MQDYLKKICKECGVFFTKLESKSARGFPDVMLAKNGKIVFVELKTPKKTGRLHGLQVKTIAQLTDAGVDVRVVDSKPTAANIVASVR